MAGTVSATVTISVVLSGDVSGNLTNPVAFTLTNSPFERQLVVLAPGFNALTVPTGARGLLVVSPNGSTNGKTLKGITGDQGIPIDPANPSFLPLPSVPGSMGITSVGGETVEIYWL